MNDVAIIEAGSDIAVSLPKGAALLTVFTTDGAIDPLLNRIRAEIDRLAKHPAYVGVAVAGARRRICDAINARARAAARAASTLEQE